MKSKTKTKTKSNVKKKHTINNNKASNKEKCCKCCGKRYWGSSMDCITGKYKCCKGSFCKKKK